jgi:DNA-binding NarL/FixJ family response regulator
MRALRVLVADEDPVSLKRIVDLVKSIGKLESCGEASNGREAVEKSKGLKPHVVILGAQMAVADGLLAAQEIRRILPKAHMLLMGADGHEPLERELERIGADGWIPKSAGPLVLLSVIEEALQIELLFLGEPKDGEPN